jgi:hypothetical protein
MSLEILLIQSPTTSIKHIRFEDDMQIAMESIKPNQIFISELQLDRVEHYPAVALTQEFLGKANYLYLKVNHINLFSH